MGPWAEWLVCGPLEKEKKKKKKKSSGMGKCKRQNRADTDSDADTDSAYKERVVTILLCNHYESGHGYLPKMVCPSIKVIFDSY